MGPRPPVPNALRGLSSRATTEAQRNYTEWYGSLSSLLDTGVDKLSDSVGQKETPGRLLAWTRGRTMCGTTSSRYHRYTISVIRGSTATCPVGSTIPNRDCGL